MVAILIGGGAADRFASIHTVVSRSSKRGSPRMNPSPPKLRDTILVPEALRGLPIINRVMQHAPLYSLQAWAGAFDARPLGLTRVERSHVNPDYS